MTDDRLRDRFRALREEDARTAPLYSVVTRRARRAGAAPAGVLRWPAAAAFASIVLAVSTFAVRHAGEEHAARAALARKVNADVLSGRWESPTDFLLETPGEDVLHTLPHVDAPSDLLLLLGPRPADAGKGGGRP